MGGICILRNGAGLDGSDGSGEERTSRVAAAVPGRGDGPSIDLPVRGVVDPADSPSPLSKPGRYFASLFVLGGFLVLRYMLKDRRARLAWGTNRLAARILSEYMPEAKKRKRVVRAMTKDAS